MLPKKKSELKELKELVVQSSAHTMITSPNIVFYAPEYLRVVIRDAHTKKETEIYKGKKFNRSAWEKKMKQNRQGV